MKTPEEIAERYNEITTQLTKLKNKRAEVREELINEIYHALIGYDETNPMRLTEPLIDALVADNISYTTEPTMTEYAEFMSIDQVWVDNRYNTFFTDLSDKPVRLESLDTPTILELYKRIDKTNHDNVLK